MAGEERAREEPAQEALPAAMIRGVAAGVGGAAVMTAFQKLVEMRVTGRKDSFAPAKMVAKLLPLGRGAAKDPRLNYAGHFALGASWGAARAVAGRAGLSGQPAVAATLGVLWPGDVLAMTALGLDKPPWRWSRKDLAIDVVDKLVLAEAIGAIYAGLGARGK